FFRSTTLYHPSTEVSPECLAQFILKSKFPTSLRPVSSMPPHSAGPLRIIPSTPNAPTMALSLVLKILLASMVPSCSATTAQPQRGLRLHRLLMQRYLPWALKTSTSLPKRSLLLAAPWSKKSTPSQVWPGRAIFWILTEMSLVFTNPTRTPANSLATTQLSTFCLVPSCPMHCCHDAVAQER